MNNFDLSKYIDIALRRKYWIIIPFLLVVLAGLGYLLTAPKIYEARTLILVQPQKVPQEFVQAIVSTDIDERLRTITQQVTSRTNLESIIQEYQLYNSPKYADMFLEQKVALLREKIDIDVVRGGSGGNAFAVSFQEKDPRKVMQVTNALASNFISENLKIRESQALGTSTFLAEELDSITNRLKETEEKLKEYRLRYMGALPDQLQTNLNILGRLQMQQEQLSSNLSDAENRKLIIQQQLADSELIQRQLTESNVNRSRQITGIPLPSQEQSREQEELNELKRELASLETRYTENHPDVKRLKQVIANLEDDGSSSEIEVAGQTQEDLPVADIPDVETRGIRPDNIISTQLQQVDLEINSIKKDIKDVQSRILVYQRRVEDTPKREQELVSLNRDYENLRELYNSMLNRKLEAEIAVSMEKKQKGEQFRVIDPAKLPQRPIAPDSRKVLLMTLALGLGLGCGLAYMMELMDTSFRDPEELEKELQLPVLVSLPFRYTEKRIKNT